MEAEYAPPDHEVFQLTPLPFDSHANKYYEEMGRPPVSSSSFWDVYQQLLARFRGAEPSDDLTEVLSDLENQTEQISKEKVDVLPGLKPLRLGATVVGDGINDNDSEIEVAMTESEEEEGNEAGPSAPLSHTSGTAGHGHGMTLALSESSIGPTQPSAPTFAASMTPSESSIGPTRTSRTTRTIPSSSSTYQHHHT